MDKNIFHEEITFLHYAGMDGTSSRFTAALHPFLRQQHFILGLPSFQTWVGIKATLKVA
jgi:hypothetical protein